ncbi:MAG: acyl-CoA/acyl-ACP dehydrogenase [Acidimicrobiia bacterium]|nr:acyl-CoA/acyl-ACP dehydrogenase [Acidimicrobiia bacterium]
MSGVEHLSAAQAAVASAQDLLDTAVAALAQQSESGGKLVLDLMDEHQIACYDLAYAASAVDGARRVLDAYAPLGETEALLAVANAADVVADLRARVDGRLPEWGIDRGAYDSTAGAPAVTDFLDAARSAATVDAVAAAVCDVDGVPGGPSHLDDDLAMMAESFTQFGEDKIRPVAEEVHRSNGDVPESIIAGVAELGCFGLSIPEEYGGLASADIDHTIAMVVATEMLSWASLGLGGALITRPEILSKAIVGWGTEEQKHRWLPGIAAGEHMVGVAVTEPDFGSDVANLKVRAVECEGGYLVNGVKTWCTFAGRADLLMLLARTGTPEDGHRGLSLFVVPKSPHAGHHFEETRESALGTSRMEGRAIDTLGYRGMHSFEVSFDNWFVPAADLVGGDAGAGKGFYMQMDAFANGRVQTAARAVGLMQAAFEKARDYARDRVVFGKPVYDYQLTRWKLARMAWMIQACRQYTYQVAAMLSSGEGQLEASMVKMYACRCAEWVTREAMQIHGGMGYAEEYDVSRYFVDARVLTIFEGAEETLALRVIIRRLLEQALAA